MKAKKSPTSRSNGSVQNWKQRCVKLQAERDRLRREFLEIRSERDRYLKALYALTDELVDFDKDAVFAELGKRPPLRQLIAKLESSGK